MDHVTQHFRPEERPLVERASEWAEWVLMRHKPQLTSFVNPREQAIIQAVAKAHSAVTVSAWGGYEDAERKRVFIAPDYLTPSFEDYQLTLLGIEEAKPETISHRDVLGSILGLGIKREKVGDILISGHAIQVIIAREMESYIRFNLNKVGKTAVKTTVLNWENLRPASEPWERRMVTVSSLRLDAVLAPCVHMSRTKALGLIKGGKVQVNWKVEDSPAAPLDEGDILSVKGYGRFQVLEVVGRTRKDNIILHLGYKK
jgi:RNA-binding protein YlmH